MGLIFGPGCGRIQSFEVAVILQRTVQVEVNTGGILAMSLPNQWSIDSNITRARMGWAASTMMYSVSTDHTTSAKTRFPSLYLFSLLYPQTQKNKIEVSLQYGIALLFQSVHWVIAMLFSSITKCVPTFQNVTTSTWQTVHTSFAYIPNHHSAYFYVAHFNLSSRRW